MSAGLTDTEREGGWHVTQAFYTGLVFSEPAVARIKADAIATARAEERARLTATGFNDELTDLASFVWVETQHKPTQMAVIRLRDSLRAITKAAGQ